MLTSEQIFHVICYQHHAVTMLEYEDRLKHIKMTSEEFTWSTLTEYINEFELEMKVLGNDHI